MPAFFPIRSVLAAAITLDNSSPTTLDGDPPPKPGRLILLRHGESEWNATKQFAGWYDTPLTKKGVAEARQAGANLRHAGFSEANVHMGFTSQLCRAGRTLELVLEELGAVLPCSSGSPESGAEVTTPPIYCSWRLNERHVGALTGVRYDQACAADHFALLNSSVQTPLPPLLPESPYFSAVQERQYDPQMEEQDGPPRATPRVPNGESRAEVQTRVVEFFRDSVEPLLREGKTVIVACHAVVVSGLRAYLETGTGGECDFVTGKVGAREQAGEEGSPATEASPTGGGECDFVADKGEQRAAHVGAREQAAHEEDCTTEDSPTTAASAAAAARALGFLDGREQSVPFLSDICKVPVRNAVPYVYEFYVNGEQGELAVDIERLRIVDDDGATAVVRGL